MKTGPDQFRLDFTSQLHERLARIRALEVPLAGEVDWTPERIQGVIELLQRICILSHDGTTSKARINALAARVADRRAYTDRTIRNWRNDAESLGLLVCEVVSHERGGWHPNRWSIQWDQIKRRVLITPPDSGRKRGGNDFRPRAEMTSAPRKIDPVTRTKDPPPPTSPVEASGSCFGREEDFCGVAADRSQPVRDGAAPQWAAICARLKALDLDRAEAIARDCRRAQMRPEDVGAVLDQFEANRQIFSGAGAIAYRLREGHWPVRGVLETEVALAQRAQADQHRARRALAEQQAEYLRRCHQLQRQITQQAQQQGCSAEQLQMRLRQALPAEFFDQYCTGPSVAELRKEFGV